MQSIHFFYQIIRAYKALYDKIICIMDHQIINKTKIVKIKYSLLCLLGSH